MSLMNNTMNSVSKMTCGGLSRHGPHRLMGLDALPTGSGTTGGWPCWKKYVNVGAGFEISYVLKLHPVWDTKLRHQPQIQNKERNRMQGYEFLNPTPSESAPQERLQHLPQTTQATGK